MYIDAIKVGSKCGVNVQDGFGILRFISITSHKNLFWYNQCYLLIVLYVPVFTQ